MSPTPVKPDIGALEIPMDAWTQPFWEATAEKKLLLPQCADCQRYRWPPGPFCPHCQSQRLEWQPPGAGYLYSYTIVPSSATSDAGDQTIHIPGLVEFPEADCVRLLAAIVDSPVEDITIGARLETDWSQAGNALMPVFRIARP